MEIDALFTTFGWSLEEGAITVFSLMGMLVFAAGAYIYRLRVSLRHHRQLLEEQSRFLRRLNATVDRMLRIDSAGHIDSDRRRRP